MKKDRGFTLIELLVVIAIIGILSSVVLASLNNARARGANASVKANLASFRAQAEIYYDTTGNGTYGSSGNSVANCLTVCTTGCTPAHSLFMAHRNFLIAAQSAGGGTALCVAQPLSNSTSYVVSVQLRQPEGAFNHWCVDSSGNSRGHATAISGSPTVCP